MYKIIDLRGSGKTSRLMLLAKENNGILVCSSPYDIEKKAAAYGLTGLEIISYAHYFYGKYQQGKPIFIDELENYVKFLGNG